VGEFLISVCIMLSIRIIYSLIEWLKPATTRIVIEAAGFDR
jgi:hypothetical protein